MPDQDLDRLAAEVAELHADALHAARVERVCQVAAGQRLIELRASMGARVFEQWIAGGQCPVLPATAAAYVAAAEQHAGQAQEPA